MTAVREAFVTLEGMTKRFGAVRALGGVSLDIHPGDRIGLVGHNGAGKSTLMHLLAGTLSADEGAVCVDGRVETGYDVARAAGAGVRCVYQELSLCPNLSASENVLVRHGSIARVGWRRRAVQLVGARLSEIFPDHGIALSQPIGELSIARRQMVEIACAFTVVDAQARLVILDEPTSSLDAVVAEQLLAFVGRFTAAGGACILISHRLGEVLQSSDRIIVMRDGMKVDERATDQFTRDSLVEAMGSVRDVIAGVSMPTNDAVGSGMAGARGTQSAHAAEAAEAAPDTNGATRRGSGEPCIRIRTTASASPAGRGDSTDSPELQAWPGEIVALAGLEGQGQARVLERLFDVQRGRRAASREVVGRLSLVAGDRQRDGIFPLWSIADNITIGSMRERSRCGLIDRTAEASMAANWSSRMAIHTPSVDDSILSLSGGNQQKALFARALGADTGIVLMDDPMRGVDVETKREVYAMIRDEAARGRTFIWYTTELDELLQCDFIYVFRDQRIVDGFERAAYSDERVLDSSFEAA